MTSGGANRLVRPYLVTKGRTRAPEELPVEALVETVSHAPLERTGGLQFESRRVLQLCAQARSIAELAASLAVPLGVARVLVSDLAADGLVRIHRTATDGHPDVVLLERLLDGLHAC